MLIYNKVIKYLYYLVFMLSCNMKLLMLSVSDINMKYVVYNKLLTFYQ